MLVPGSLRAGQAWCSGDAVTMEAQDAVADMLWRERPACCWQQLLTTAPGINCWQQLTAPTSIYGRQHLGSGDSNCTALLRTLEVVMEGSNTDPKNVKQEFHIFLHISSHSMISCSWCNMCAGAVRVAQLILSSTHSCTVAAAQFHCTAPFALHHNHNRRCWCFFRCCKSRPVINHLLRCKNAKLNVKAVLLDKTHLFQY